MAYVKANADWKAWPDTTTPITQAALDTIEDGIVAAVAKDEVIVAGTRLVANKLQGADTQPAFRILGDGKVEWGVGGTTALDVNLYRSAANVLKTDDTLQVGTAVTLTPPNADLGNAAYDVWVTGETQRRWYVARNGDMTWGSGSAAGDTNLYRSAADTLKTDDSLLVGANFSHLGSSLGFYNTAPIAKPTGVAVTAIGIHAALVSLGLIAA
jgi:hypothetical protein